MTIENTTPFNLADASTGSPLVTRSGDYASFIAYVPEATFDNQRVLFLVNGQIRSCNVNGLFNANVENASDLFMLTKTSEVNGFSYPSALTEPPSFNTIVYITDISSSDFCFDISWTGEEYDVDVLNRGIVHLTQDNAVAHAQAIILACGGTFDNE